MKEKYLPIGTIVTLNEAIKKVLIIGYCPINDKNELYDYSACPFPEGLSTPNMLYAFNHDQIKTIEQLGIENEEYENFNTSLKAFVKGMENIKKISFPSETESENI